MSLQVGTKASSAIFCHLDHFVKISDIISISKLIYINHFEFLTWPTGKIRAKTCHIAKILYRQGRPGRHRFGFQVGLIVAETLELAGGIRGFAPTGKAPPFHGARRTREYRTCGTMSDLLLLERSSAWVLSTLLGRAAHPRKAHGVTQSA